MRIKQIVVISFVLLGTFLLSGCNTTRGIGQDISSGGHAIQRAANS